jgi:hypothetical protein
MLIRSSYWRQCTMQANETGNFELNAPRKRAPPRLPH